MNQSRIHDMKRSVQLLFLMCIATSCLSTIQPYRNYSEKQVGNLDDPVLVFPTSDSLFVCPDYVLLHDIIYPEHYSAQFRNFDSFLLACIRKKVDLSLHFLEYPVNKNLEDEALEDFDAFINRHCTKGEDGGLIISYENSGDRPNVIRILFEHNYHIMRDCYWGFYRAHLIQ